MAICNHCCPAIAEKLDGKGIVIKPSTLAKYLKEVRQKREQKVGRPAQRKSEAPLAENESPEVIIDEQETLCTVNHF